jgi:hypothetical protein
MPGATGSALVGSVPGGGLLGVADAVAVEVGVARGADRVAVLVVLRRVEDVRAVVVTVEPAVAIGVAEDQEPTPNWSK